MSYWGSLLLTGSAAHPYRQSSLALNLLPSYDCWGFYLAAPHKYDFLWFSWGSSKQKFNLNIYRNIYNLKRVFPFKNAKTHKCWRPQESTKPLRLFLSPHGRPLTIIRKPSSLWNMVNQVNISRKDIAPLVARFIHHNGKIPSDRPS